MEKTIKLIPADIKNKEDIDFLYEIVKMRWKYKDIINIKYKTKDNIPSYEEHIQFLNSNNYKKIYKVYFYNFLIGMIYIDYKNFNGTFLMPNLLKNAIKNLKNKNIKFDKDDITPQIHIELFKKHPEVTVHYASINPKNKLSLDALLKNGYEQVEIILAFTTENGECTQGKWSVKK
jgi:hypothetical protein